MIKTRRIISILLSAVMLTGLTTITSFAAALPTTFGWSIENAGYITINVPDFDGNEVEYLLDLYKDGNRISDDFGVFFEEGGEYESDIFADTISELGNGTYTYKIGFERDFDTDVLINSTGFSSEYVVTSFSHSVDVEPAANTDTNTGNNASNTPDDTTGNTSVPEDNTQAEDKKEEASFPTAVITGQVTYANKYPKESVYDPINYGETKPLAYASINLYKKNGLGNTRPFAKTSTDLNGNFELAYNQGNYDLIVFYGSSNMTVNINAESERIDLGTIKFEPYAYISSPNSPALILPYDTNVIEITDDNLNDYFEAVKVIGEFETDSSKLDTVKSYENNVYCGITLPKDTLFVDLYDMETGNASFDEENELWLIAPNNARQFISMSEGPSKQISGIYDEKNNVLYHSTMTSSDSSGYVFSHLRKNGIVSITKYDTISYGMPTTYKITRMTARFKKLPYVTVSYNDELIEFDQKPVIEDGRTLVPLRAIFEKIGAVIDWNGDTQTVTATKDDTTISLTINNTTATKNGQPIELDVPAKIIGGRTLVPVRFVADCFGVNVDWNGDIRKVILTK